MSTNTATLILSAEPAPESCGEIPLNPNDPHFDVWHEESFGPLLERFLAGERMPAFLGLSAHTSFSNAGRFRGLLRWLAPRVSTCAVLEGTFLTRWNLQALQGLDAKGAEAAVRFESARIERRLKRLISEAGLEGRVFFTSWKQLVSSTEVLDRIAVLRSCARDNCAFGEQVEKLTLSYLRRTTLARPDAVLVKGLSEYVLEEIAVFLHLCESGRLVEIYPGPDLEVMRLISRGQLDGFPFECPSRTHVALHAT